MSRTTLSTATAAVLAVLSIGMMIGRYFVLGDEVKLPRGPNTWKVTLKASGKSISREARLMTVTPLDFRRQHISNVECRSPQMLNKPPSARHPERREVLWLQRGGVPEGPFTAYYHFYCTVDFHRPTSSMNRLAESLYQPPRSGDYLQSESLLECNHPDIAALGRRLSDGRHTPDEQAEALFYYVDRQVRNEPTGGSPRAGALTCLNAGGGDSGAKSRLLVALCRNRDIPARMITGLRLSKAPDEVAHSWVEAWLRDQWVPMCPFYHYYGRVPSSYLVLGMGDLQVVRGRGVRDLNYGFLVERTTQEEQAAAIDPWPLRRFLRQVALDTLPPAEERLVEFLLLVPIAALIVCIFRHLIGVSSFGTFAPALVGLAFRELHSMPGILVFVSIVLLGWGMRKILNHYHLLQVPRTALMLSLVVIVLIFAVVTANYQNPPLAATKYVSLFPIVILTGMIERFWTLEVEDSTSSSFRTLLGTMVIAATISGLLSFHALVNHMFRFPETLGLIMALQLLIGRYTGYRLAELFRFRDFAQAPEAS
jgi:hypothetical protein